MVLRHTQRSMQTIRKYAIVKDESFYYYRSLVNQLTLPNVMCRMTMSAISFSFLFHMPMKCSTINHNTKFTVHEFCKHRHKNNFLSYLCLCFGLNANYNVMPVFKKNDKKMLICCCSVWMLLTEMSSPSSLYKRLILTQHVCVTARILFVLVIYVVSNAFVVEGASVKFLFSHHCKRIISMLKRNS